MGAPSMLRTTLGYFLGPRFELNQSRCALVSVFDSLVDIAGIVQGGFFLRKKPLRFSVSVKSRIETAVSLAQGRHSLVVAST